MGISLLVSRNTETQDITYDLIKTILIYFHATSLSSAAHFMLDIWSNTNIHPLKQLTCFSYQEIIWIALETPFTTHNFGVFHDLKVSESCSNLYRWLMVIKGSKGLPVHRNCTAHAVFQRPSSWNSNLQNECPYHAYCDNWICFYFKPLCWNFSVKHLTPTSALQLTSGLQLISASESLLFVAIFSKHYVIITRIRKHSHIITVSSVFLCTDSLKVLFIFLTFCSHSDLNTEIPTCMILEETKSSDSKKEHNVKFS